MSFARLFSAAAVLSLALTSAGNAEAPANATIPWAQLPVGYHPAPDTDEGGLWMIGGKAEAETRNSPLLVKDAALNTYLRTIVCKLSGPYCESIRIYVLDIPYVNARMAPNGMLQVWTGLLLRGQNEAEISFVLGHEISHYLLQHTIAQYRRVRDQAGTIAVLGALTAGIGSLAKYGLAGSAASFSREEERQADQRGFELATAAGYDPAQCIALWQQELAEETVAPKENSEFAAYAENHPATSERLSVMSAMASAAQAQRTSWQTNADAYRKAIAPFRTQWINENIALAQYEQSLLVLQLLLKDEPKSGELRYYMAEVYRRRNADGDSAKALAAYAAAVTAGGAPPAVYRGLGLTSLKAGDKATARTAFQKYLAALPSADDRAMIEYYLSQP